MTPLRVRARLASAVLLALAGGAVFAPWLAGERPLLLEAVDRAGFDQARNGQVAVAARLAQRALEGAPAAELAGERAALEARLRVLRRYLAPGAGEADAVDAVAERAATLLRAVQDARARAAGGVAGGAEGAPGPDPAAGEGADPAVAAAGAELAAAASGLRERLDPAGADAPVLRPRVSFPALAATTGPEVALMVLWLAAALALLGAPPRAALAGGAVAAVAAGALWTAAVHDAAAARAAGFKRGLTEGGLVAERAVFPPLAMGHAETNFTEALRPPTWAGEAEIGADGHYVRGARRPDAGTDPLLRHPPRPVEVRAAEPPRNAAWRHPLGTDALGRDVLARLLHGGRVSLAVGLLAAALLTVLGVAVGAVAGYFGGRVDAVLLRVVEVVDAIPTLFLVLFASALAPEGGVHPMVVVAVLIALAGWTGVARLVRGEFLRLKPLEFVEAARALGFSHARVAFRHVLPNALGPAWVAGAFAVSSAILLESAVSFLGFGVQLPVPSWGAVLGSAEDLEHWWMFIFPGLLILVTVLCTNALGEAARERLDPRSSR